jgi:hypothetical protein
MCADLTTCEQAVLEAGFFLSKYALELIRCVVQGLRG